MILIDAYLALKGLWGSVAPDDEPFDWNLLFARLLERGLKPSDIGEMTLPEALLYTVQLEKAGIDHGSAVKKVMVLKGLGVEDRIAVSRFRSNSY